ncbi:MAG: mechanosensitive ion channel domain-containing protein [Acidimicrobiales bacterium]
MIDPWIYAAGAVVVGLLSGVVGAALVRRIILNDRRDRPEAHDAARAASTFLFLFFTVVGVVVAIGVTNADELETLPAELLRSSPRVLAAGLILIAGRAVGFAIGGAIHAAFEGSGARIRGQMSAIARGLTFVIALVLALTQLGVETTILSVLVGAASFGLAVAFALLVGLGGREMGAEIAAGRSVQRLISIGDEVVVDGLSGTVAALHPTSVELRSGDGSSVHLANTRLTRGELRVSHSDPNPDGSPST